MGAKRSERIAWLLYHMPAAPKRGLTVSEFADRLDRAGLAASQNAIWRDLQDIQSALGPGIVECDDPGNGRGHRWRLTGASHLSLPGQSLNLAVALKVLARDGRKLVPPSVLEELAPLFSKADGVLGLLAHSDPLARWPERVRLNRPLVRRAIERIPPRVAEGVRETVNRAIAEQRRLSLVYRSRSAGATLELDVLPIGIDNAMTQDTFVCTVEDPDPSLPEKYANPYVQLVLHRIEKATLLDRTNPPEIAGRSMDEYLEKGEPDLPRGGARLTEGRTIRLEASLSEWAYEELAEAPLSEDQQLDISPSGERVVAAAVPQSDNLKWWCLAMLPDLIVTGPSDFRDEVAEAVERAHREYRSRR